MKKEVERGEDLERIREEGDIGREQKLVREKKKNSAFVIDFRKALITSSFLLFMLTATT